MGTWDGKILLAREDQQSQADEPTGRYKSGTEHSRSLEVAKERTVFNFNPFASPIALAEKSFVNSEERIIYHQVHTRTVQFSSETEFDCNVLIDR